MESKHLSKTTPFEPTANDWDASDDNLDDYNPVPVARPEPEHKPQIKQGSIDVQGFKTVLHETVDSIVSLIDCLALEVP